MEISQIQFGAIFSRLIIYIYMDFCLLHYSTQFLGHPLFFDYKKSNNSIYPPPPVHHYNIAFLVDILVYLCTNVVLARGGVGSISAVFSSPVFDPPEKERLDA